MKSITRLVKRLLTGDSPSTSRSAAPVLEPMEGRLLMSTTLPTQLTTESPEPIADTVSVNFYKMTCGPDGTPIPQSDLPTESVSLNFTRVQLSR